ncbi:hypothetical protein [Anatilimnocola aggregata]|uniref:hypothetical protein n=1 Tax=Anatilimnocola aggregata TaxID=2528021 RepID=UPI00192E4711|nr:hypothetical protein [Anatilimnocola aggregata]
MERSTDGTIEAIPTGEAVKLPKPDEEAEKKATQLVREIFKDEYRNSKSPTQQIELAHKLIVQAAKDERDVVGNFVLLRIARDIASDAGDATLTLRAIDLMSAKYEANHLDLKAVALGRAASVVVKPDEQRTIAQAALDLATEASRTDGFAVAQKLNEIAASAARKSRVQEVIRQATTAKIRPPRSRS